MVTLAFSSAGGVSTASAHNDSCVSGSPNWHCIWYDQTQAPNAMHWFFAEVTLRNWTSGAISGENGYYVENKCTHITTSASVAHQVACGWGYQSGGIPANWRPGYLWTRHGASGPRWISGHGWH